MNKWYIVTNTENLMHFINFGLIIDEQGYLSKNSYTKDIAHNIVKGYIPCFTEKNIEEPISEAKKYESNLTACLLELDTNELADTLVYPYNSNEPSDFKSLAQKNEQLLIPAPLPFGVIGRLVFEDSETMKKIQADYELKNSTKVKFDTDTKLFEKNIESKKQAQPDGEKGQKELFQASESSDTKTKNYLTQTTTPTERIINYPKIFAYGGALYFFYYQTKNGKETTDLFNRFHNYTKKQPKNPEKNNLIDPFLGYFFHEKEDPSDDIESYYRLIMNKLVVAYNDDHGQRLGIISETLTSNEIPTEIKERCEKLNSYLKENIQEKIKSTTPKEAIKKILSKNEFNKEKLFYSLSIFLTVFSLFNNSETALKFYHEKFDEEFYAFLAVFFGVSYNIANIPVLIKQNINLSNWVSYKMAKYAHEELINDNTVNECKTKKDKTKSVVSKIPNSPEKRYFLKTPSLPILLFNDCIKQKEMGENKKFYDDLHDQFNKMLPSYENKNDQKEMPFTTKYKYFLKCGNDVSLEYRHANKDNQINFEIEITGHVLEESHEISVNKDSLASWIRENIGNDKLFDLKPIVEIYKKYYP